MLQAKRILADCFLGHQNCLSNFFNSFDLGCCGALYVSTLHFTVLARQLV